jgi:hypothetical protein
VAVFPEPPFGMATMSRRDRIRAPASAGVAPAERACYAYVV